MAAARDMPGVWGVFGSSSPARTILTPQSFQCEVPASMPEIMARGVFSLFGTPLHICRYLVLLNFVAASFCCWAYCFTLGGTSFMARTLSAVVIASSYCLLST